MALVLGLKMPTSCPQNVTSSLTFCRSNKYEQFLPGRKVIFFHTFESSHSRPHQVAGGQETLRDRASAPAALKDRNVRLSQRVVPLT